MFLGKPIISDAFSLRLRKTQTPLLLSASRLIQSPSLHICRNYSDQQNNDRKTTFKPFQTEADSKPPGTNPFSYSDRTNNNNQYRFNRNNNGQYSRNNQYSQNNQYPRTNQYSPDNQYPGNNPYSRNNQYSQNNQYPRSNQYSPDNTYPRNSRYPQSNQYTQNNQSQQSFPWQKSYNKPQNTSFSFNPRSQTDNSSNSGFSFAQRFKPNNGPKTNPPSQNSFNPNTRGYGPPFNENNNFIPKWNTNTSYPPKSSPFFKPQIQKPDPAFSKPQVVTDPSEDLLFTSENIEEDEFIRSPLKNNKKVVGKHQPLHKNVPPPNPHLISKKDNLSKQKQNPQTFSKDTFNEDTFSEVSDSQDPKRLQKEIRRKISKKSAYNFVPNSKVVIPFAVSVNSLAKIIKVKLCNF
ncbi:hypothetical protein BB560_001248 [Smittium megazygosporum]|uniref:Uncharacterized protein n=1 Tax=Smittium megazygosporum TaxID=133381 RepID=A0A2T9ZI52_9FUNG|nr:hypothetical protein BB560_001248 [Smittium megazygosporum]